MTDERTDELRGWKEISAYLGKSVRAAQRWEASYGLPVRRIAVPSRAAIVYARRSEIEGWKAGLDPRSVSALQDENEDDTETATDAEAGDNGCANGVPPVTTFEPRPSVAAASTEGVPSVVATPAVPVFSDGIPPRVDGVPGGRRRLWPWLVTASVIATIGLATVAWSRSGSANPTTAAEAIRPAASPGWERVGLDGGPWPMAGHDRRNSYQSHLVGPEVPSPPRQLLDVPSGLASTFALAALADGTYLVGACDGGIITLAPDGRILRTLRLERTPNPEAASGFVATAEPQDFVFVATRDCPHDFAVNARTQIVAIGTDVWSVAWRFRTGMQMAAPTVAADGALLQVDHYNTLRRLSAFGAPVWIADFPGFSTSTPAQDGSGVLYLPSDGGVHGHRSLWAVSREGKVLWGAGTETFIQASVGLDGHVYVAQSTTDVFARRGVTDMVRSFDPDGRERWAVPIPTDPSLNGVERLAVSSAGDVVVKTAGSIMWLDPANGSTRYTAPIAGAWQGSTNVVLDARGNAYHTAHGQVISLSPEGRERWSVPLPGAGALIIGHDGDVVVTANQRKLYVIRDAGPAPETSAGP